MCHIGGISQTYEHKASEENMCLTHVLTSNTPPSGLTPCFDTPRHEDGYSEEQRRRYAPGLEHTRTLLRGTNNESVIKKEQKTRASAASTLHRS